MEDALAPRLSPDASEDVGPFELQAYRRMYSIRRFEQIALDLSQTSPPAAAGSMHLCAGQEAIPVGALAALRDTDQVVATYRGHGWALEAGVPPLELLSEICHREGGVNGGRAGSAYVMAPHRRFIGENSIVGAGGPIAAGVAMAQLRRGEGDLTIVSFGDGAMSQGALHESLVFAAAYDLPVIFLCENNGWSEMTATSAMVKVDNLSRRGRGYGVEAVTIDGGDPVAVRDTIMIVADRMRREPGPYLIECKAPRLWGHYNRDIEHYRTKADKAEAASADPLVRLEARIADMGLASPDDLTDIRQQIDAELESLAQAVVGAPPPSSESAHLHVWSAEVHAPVSPGPEPAEVTYAQAVNLALRAELETRPEVIIYGEDVGRAGGIFGATRYLQRDFGEDRVFDTPIAEAAILGSAVGAAMMGQRPVVEIMWADFLLVALDQLVNQAANVRYITGGQAAAPIVVRTQQGATPGSCAQHSQCLETLLAHIPGIRVGLPATPQDAYDMLRAAVASNDPTILFEARSLYQVKGRVADGGSPWGARLRRDGGDVAIITWGTMLQPCLEAAEILSSQGVEASVLDLRWLSPLDDAAVFETVRRCGGRALVAHEANLTGGFGAELVARVTEGCWTDLKAPVRRVALPDVRMPAAPALQAALLPSAATVSGAALQLVREGR